MDRINKIWNHPLYQEQFRLLQQSEKDRFFCRHTLEHFLDVARLSWIYNLEDGSGIDRELIYAAALLHDIGRYRQITEGISHEKAGAALAEQILPACGFQEKEISEICSAILGHRSSSSEHAAYTAQTADTSPGGLSDTSGKLSIYLYRADKQSRCCFACPASSACNWSEEKKNLSIKR